MSSFVAASGSTDAGGGGGAQAGRVSLRDLCCLFCCPPCPSSVVSKLAFMPPEPTYKLLPNETGSQYTLQFIEGRSDWPHGQEELRDVDAYFTRSSRSNRIACMFVRPFGGVDAKFTILFSHGNAVDLGQMCSFYYGLGSRLGCNIFSYDYSGYGCSSGKPTEKNLYADIGAAWHSLHTRYGVSPQSVVLYGQSIGTVPTVDLASRLGDVGAVVLHSPLTSGMRVAFPATSRTWCCDAFPSIEKVSKMRAPTLVIHGTEDEVIDFSHGVAIYERCPTSVEPLWIVGAGHNDVELHAAYLERLKQFIDDEAAGGADARLASRSTDDDAADRLCAGL